MSGADWVSAHEAQCRAKDVGFTGDDLLEWARLGRLRTRAKSRVDSDDVSPPNLWFECVISHPEEPPADEGARVALGMWPDVPADFWAEQPAKANWGAGTFANKVHYFCDHHQELTYAYLELFDVTFHTGDLGALLAQSLAKLAPATATEAELGALPNNATPGQRRYEGAAHRAAEIQRSQNGFLSEALRQALDETEAVREGVQDTRERQLRAVFKLMYNKDGRPIRNDPD